MNESKRVEIGFGGGQVMTTRLEAKRFQELRDALTSADGKGGSQWYEVESEDGTISLDLSQIVFIRVAGAPHTIGFSGT
jgi:hypothetical protein